MLNIPSFNYNIDCSGLVTISRFPILDTSFHRFSVQGSGMDDLASKGVGRIRIEPFPESFNFNPKVYIYIYVCVC